MNKVLTVSKGLIGWDEWVHGPGDGQVGESKMESPTATHELQKDALATSIRGSRI